MHQLRLVLVLVGLWVAVPSTVVFAQINQSATVADPIGPWFIGAEKEKVPNLADLDVVAREAVVMCPGHAVVCDPYASTDVESTRWNKVYARRRAEACLAAVNAAGGKGTWSGAFKNGTSGDRGRGVELSCATIAPQAANESIPEPHRPVTPTTLPEAIEKAQEAGDISSGSLTLTVGAGVIPLLDALGAEYNSSIYGLYLSPAWEDGMLALRVTGLIGAGPKDSIRKFRQVLGMSGAVTAGVNLGDWEIGGGIGAYFTAPAAEYTSEHGVGPAVYVGYSPTDWLTFALLPTAFRQVGNSTPAEDWVFAPTLVGGFTFGGK